MTKVIACTCVNVQQDQIHGAGMRVHNLSTKNSRKTWVCTVCLDRKDGGNNAPQKAAKADSKK